MATTQLHPGAIIGPPYGSFAGKGGSPRPSFRATQLHPGAIIGRQYGSFAGKDGADVYAHIIERSGYTWQTITISGYTQRTITAEGES